MRSPKRADTRRTRLWAAARRLEWQIMRDALSEAPHMMGAALWCRDQTPASRNYPTLPPEENRVDPSYSRHMSPRLTLQIPLGPSKIAIPFVTSRSDHPSIVVGLVSGIDVSFARLSRSLVLSRKEAECCSNAGWSIVDGLCGAANRWFRAAARDRRMVLRTAPHIGRPARLRNRGGIANSGRRVDDLPRQVRRTTDRTENSFEFAHPGQVRGRSGRAHYNPNQAA
jgi:hypothetical protein